MAAHLVKKGMVLLAQEARTALKISQLYHAV